MKIIVCVDDGGGMTFNNRRQSRDRVLIDDVMKMTDGKTLYIDAYSKPLFEDFEGRYTVEADMLSLAGDDDFCFVERSGVRENVDRIHEIVVYRWNRAYPSDFKFDIEPLGEGFVLCETEEFAGYSHEKITKEIFRK